MTFSFNIWYFLGQEFTRFTKETEKNFLQDPGSFLARFSPGEALKNNKLAQPPKVETDYKKYLFSVTTKPNNGEYEFTVLVQNRLDGTNGDSGLDNATINRINKYGNDEHCIHEKCPDLQKYCYCKDKKAKNNNKKENFIFIFFKLKYRNLLERSFCKFFKINLLEKQLFWELGLRFIWQVVINVESV